MSSKQKILLDTKLEYPETTAYQRIIQRFGQKSLRAKKGKLKVTGAMCVILGSIVNN